MRRRVVPLLISLLLAAGCTSSGDDSQVTTTTTTAPTTRATEPTTVVTEPPVAVDRGVDVESEVISIGVIGEPSDELLSGLSAYWTWVNDTGGIGGRFAVEVIGFAGMAEAGAGRAVAVISTDVPPDPDPAMLVVTEPGAAGPAMLGDLVRPTVAGQVGAAAVLVGGEPAAVVVGEGAPEACSSPPDGWDPVAAAGVDPAERTVVVCDAAAARALLAGDTDFLRLVILADVWEADLAASLGERAATVVGSVPGPGVDAAPAGELLALVLGEGPWPAETLRGYTLALTMHSVLSEALAGRDLTRRAVVAAAGRTGRDLGFGPPGVSVGEVDPESPTGVRVTDWIIP